MAISVDSIFDTNIEKTSLVFKALGHPARLKIVKHLLNNKSSIANDLVEIIPYTQPTVSRHLSELLKSGLIKYTKNGSHLIYEINPVGLSAIKELLDKLIIYASDKTKCC